MSKILKTVKSKSFRSVSFSVVGMSLLLMFQNCGQEYDQTVSSVSENERAYATTLPFAYDFDIDQIGYMSCNGETLGSNSSYFTFKAGAYGEDSGVYLRDSYRAAATQGRLTGKKMADALFESERNERAGIALAIRSSSNLQSTSGSAPSTIGAVAFDRFLNLSLSQTNIAEQLVDALPGKRINYFNLPGTNDNRTMDGRISFPVSESSTNLLRSRLSSNEYLLSLTYTTATGENDTIPGQRARSQYDPSGMTTQSGSYVFGKGYNFEFYPYDARVTGAPARSISRISRSINLENRADLGEDWVCPDDEKYIIVRPQDALRGYASGGTMAVKNETGSAITPDSSYQFSYGGGGTANIPNGDAYLENVICPTLPDAFSSNAQVVSKWKRVRNMLSHKDWYVYRGVEEGLAYNCIVPKSGGDSCYGQANENTNPSIVVQYMRNERYPSYPEDDRPRRETNCGSGTQKFCPHILSICYKR